MQFRLLFFVFLMLLISCQTQEKSTAEIRIEEKFLESIDLYPLYPGCDNFYEKEKQIACFQHKFSNFVYYQLDKFYKEDFKNIEDTLWVKFSIDSLGQTHFIHIACNDSIKHLKMDSIFYDIARMVPMAKPAIFQDKPVEVQFRIPIVTEK